MLINRCMLKLDQQAFLDTLVKNTDMFIQEYLENLGKRTIPIPDYDENSTPLKDWRGIYLWWNHKPWLIYQKWFPKSTNLLQRGPTHRGTGISILKPHSATPNHAHTDNSWSNKIIVHLPLIIPDGDVGFWVDGKIHRWKVGELFAFDITKPHYGFNNTDQDRVILILDFNAEDWRDTLKQYM